MAHRTLFDGELFFPIPLVNHFIVVIIAVISFHYHRYCDGGVFHVSTTG